MRRSWLGWLAGLVALGLGSRVLANPIVPANDGVGSVVNRVGNQFDITGGTRAGQNLFHSLLKFGLSQEQIANFLSQPSIRNILTRVTGGETSVINGLIKVTGGNSNLYLLNPAGLVFGPNAQLDIPGSFYGTTANAIKVGDGWFGLHTSPSELQRLTGNPGGFAFSSHNQVLNGELAGIIKNEGQLRVPGGERVVLAGGIVVNTGTIETPHGQIVVTATPGGRYVEITPAGSALSFRLPVAEDQALAAGNLRPLRLEDVARLATGSVEVGGTLTTASDVVNPNSRIELVGEDVKLVRGITISTAGTTGLIQVQVNPLVPVEGWVFVDRERNFEDIVNALAAGYRLVLLNRSDSGVEVVHQALAGQSGLKSLHIVGGGNEGQFWMGRDFVSVWTWDRYTEQVARWGQYLDKEGGIFLYACDLAASAFGKAFVDTIAQATGRAVSASTDVTGHAKYGANWLLEYGPGGPLPFVVNRIEEADVKLVIYPVAVKGDTDRNASNYNTANPASWELGRAVATAAAGDTVRIVNGTTVPGAGGNALNNGDTIQLAQGPITFNSGNVTLEIDNPFGGNTNYASGINNFPTTAISNVTIKAAANQRVFEINATGIVIDGKQGGITLQGNGVTFPNGGVILVNANKSLTIQGQVTVTDGESLISGGGIYADSGSTVNLQGSQVEITGNRAVLGFGGGIALNGAALNVQGAQITNNTAPSNSGGGIFATNSDVTLTDARVTGNTARLQGGGIFFVGAGKTLQVGGTSEVSSNTLTGSDGNGGGIAVSGSFGSPSLQVILKGDTKVQNNTAPNFGGGIHVVASGGPNGGPVLLTLQGNVQVSGNNARQGGGIYADANSTVTVGGNAQIGGTTAAEANKADKGGGIFVKAGSTVNLKDNAKVIGNDVTGTGNANKQGGGIYVANGGTVNFTGATGVQISNNQAKEGGGIYTLANLTIPAGVTLSGNSATSQGGGIFVPAGVTATLNGAQVGAGNQAAEGAGIYTAGTLQLVGNTQVTGNQAVGGSQLGAGVFVEAGGSATIGGSAQVSNNQGADGAGVFTRGSLVVQDSAEVTGNQSSTYGGGIHVTPSGSLTVKNNARVLGNTAAEGGGIFTNQAPVVLQDSAIVQGNQAQQGGGISTFGTAVVTLTGNTKVIGNQANGGNKQGGGIFVDAGGTVNIKGEAKVINNQASGRGGGVFAAENTLIQLQDQAQVSDNFAEGVGLPFAESVGGGIATKGTLQMFGQSQVSRNRANNFGGGIAVLPGGTAVIQDSAQVRENKAEAFSGPVTGGGGIDNQGGTVTLKDNAQVIGNEAEEGGGIRNRFSGTLKLQDQVQVSNNQANLGTKQRGGGIFVDSGTVTLGVNAGDQVKVLGNQAKEGGGIYVLDGTVNLDKLTEIGGTNTATTKGGGLYIDGSYSATVNINGETKVINNTAATGGGIYYAGGTLNFSPAPNKVIRIDGNQATGDGGGIYHTANLTIPTGVVVSNNQANNRGGGIFVPTATTLELSGQVGPTNKADQGAGIYIEGTVDLKSEALVTGNQAVGSKAQGGGIYLASGSSLTQVVGAQITQNQATQGGGVYIDTDTTLTNILVTGNTASQGAGVFVAANKTVTIGDGSKISGNIASTAGGGIFVATGGTLTLQGNAQVGELDSSNNPINPNKANQGAGIFAQGTVTLQDSSQVIGNLAPGSTSKGGGVFLASGSKLTAKDNAKINHNQAGFGGGIFASSGSILNLLQNTVQVQFNKATGILIVPVPVKGAGGGVYRQTGATTNITGGVVINNTPTNIFTGP